MVVRLSPSNQLQFFLSPQMNMSRCGYNPQQFNWNGSYWITINVGMVSILQPLSCWIANDKNMRFDWFLIFRSLTSIGNFLRSRSHALYVASVLYSKYASDAYLDWNEMARHRTIKGSLHTGQWAIRTWDKLPFGGTKSYDVTSPPGQLGQSVGTIGWN